MACFASSNTVGPLPSSVSVRDKPQEQHGNTLACTTHPGRSISIQYQQSHTPPTQ